MNGKHRRHLDGQMSEDTFSGNQDMGSGGGLRCISRVFTEMMACIFKGANILCKEYVGGKMAILISS
jgi:hypothetical protein